MSGESEGGTLAISGHPGEEKMRIGEAEFAEQVGIDVEIADDGRGIHGGLERVAIAAGIALREERGEDAEGLREAANGDAEVVNGVLAGIEEGERELGIELLDLAAKREAGVFSERHGAVAMESWRSKTRRK